MGDVVYYVAQSLDGFIADDKGEVAWIEKIPIEGIDIGYETFFDSVGAVIIGSATYEQVLGFGSYPYAAVESIVMTTRELVQPSNSKVQFSDRSLREVIVDLKRRIDKNIWLVGGSELAAGAIEQSLIDVLEITVLPVILRKGIPLFKIANTSKIHTLSLVKHRILENGMIQLRYNLHEPR